MKIELEVEMRKVVEVNLDGLKDRFRKEWELTLEANEGDLEDAEREFIIESYVAGGADDYFLGTVHDNMSYDITRIDDEGRRRRA